MPIVNNRQYRSFNATDFEAVSGDGAEYTVRGYFTTFDEPYELFCDEEGPVYEVIDRHALDATDMSDVIFQLNHEGSVLARLRNGSLKIGVDNHGGWCEAYLGGCSQGRDVYEAITSNLIDQMSFGFVFASDGYLWDGAARTSHVTHIKKLFDVSAVNFPANPGTEIHARSYLNGVIEARRQELASREREWRQRIAAAMELRTLRK